MNKAVVTAGLAGVMVALAASGALGEGKRVLFYSQSCGFRHDTVNRIDGLAFAEVVMKNYASKAGYQLSLSQDPHDLSSPDDFKKYDGLIFYTTGNPPINRKAFVNWIQSGGAFIGIHCATDTFEREEDMHGKTGPWPEYTRIIGGAFKTHKAQQEVTITVEDKQHPATKHLGDEWVIKDEIYQFREDSFSIENIHPLLSINTEKTDIAPQQMEKGKYYAVAWTREEGKGRVFYTSLGHREDVWTNPKWQQHLMGGMAWALRQK